MNGSIAIARLLSLGGIFLLASAQSAPVVAADWTGAGGTQLWSDPANWAGGVPVNGSEVVFGVAGGGDSFDNLVLSLTAFKFAPAILPAHDIHLTTGAALTLTGFGIDNVSRIPGFGEPPIPPGVIRQQFFMDPGSTMTFQNTATVGGSDAVFSLPVDLNALGGVVAGGTGGRIIFEQNSSASGPPANVFTGLRIFGASVAGAAGGELRFRNDATMGFTAGFVTFGGEVAGAAGGQAVFENRAKASGNVTNAAGDGLGGRIIFKDNAVAGGGLGLNNAGASNLQAGAEAVTQFFNDAALSGTVQNFPGQVAGAAGGRVEFHDRSRFDGTPIDPSLGSIVIFNRGAGTAGADSGHTVFFDDARIIGANTVISNETENEGTFPGTIGGITEFLGRSRAGNVTIRNAGATSAVGGSEGGRTFFRENSNAENAIINASGGGFEPGAIGGRVEFSGLSSAGNATLTAEGASTAGSRGGQLKFLESAQAANAKLFANSGSSGGGGGLIQFADTANGNKVRVTLEAGTGGGAGSLDIGLLTTVGMGLATLDGGGVVALGSKNLALGGTNLSMSFSGVIQDGGISTATGGSLTKVGTGTLILNGNNTFAGRTDILGGLLRLNGSLAGGAFVQGATLGGTGTISGIVTVGPGGIVNPGASPGTLTVLGDFVQEAGGVLQMEIGGTDPLAFDHLIVRDTLTLNGILELNFIDGYVPAEGAVFDLFSFGQKVGGFSDVVVNGLAPGLGLKFDPSLNSLSFSITSAVPLPPGFWLFAAALLGLPLRRERSTVTARYCRR